MQKVIVALLVATAIGIALVRLRPAPAAGPPSTRPLNAPPPPAPVDPAPYLAAFPLEPPQLLVSIDTRLPADRAFKQALDLFQAGNYEAAAPRFEQVHADHPQLAAAALYLGIARLFTDEIPNGIEILRQAQTSPEPDVAAYAQWYALVGIARLREPASGMAEAREVCERPGPFQARACAALAALRN